ncbi:MAG TPA: hypothetical protein VFW25_13665 [Silvibacterium sp.]|nr:hypothetical protein [Silvibacterium sp.]
MQARAALHSFRWPFFLLCGCMSAVAQPTPPTPSIDVQVTLSPAAAAKMNSLSSEEIVLSATYSGNLRGANGRPDQTGQINLPSQKTEISARPQVARIDGPHLTAGDQAKINGPILLELKAYSVQRHVIDNILSCESIRKTIEISAHQLLVLHCGLATENNGSNGDANAVPSVPAERVADTYAIYSMLLPGAPADKIARTPTPSWSLADTTVNISDMNPAVPPNGQLKAPPENVRAFNQALHDFETRKYQRFKLDANNFRPSHPIPLIGENEVSNLRHGDSGSHGIVFFSAVYFNGTRTAALVYVNDWCAHLCAAGQWVYLEKQSGQWVRRSGIFASGA